MGYRTIGLMDLDDPLGTIGGLECRDFPEAGFFLRVCAVPMEESGSARTKMVLNGDALVGFVSVIPRGSDAAAVVGVCDPWEREDVMVILSVLETETEGFGTISVECLYGMDRDLMPLGFVTDSEHPTTKRMVRRNRRGTRSTGFHVREVSESVRRRFVPCAAVPAPRNRTFLSDGSFGTRYKRNGPTPFYEPVRNVQTVKSDAVANRRKD